LAIFAHFFMLKGFYELWQRRSLLLSALALLPSFLGVFYLIAVLVYYFFLRKPNGVWVKVEGGKLVTPLGEYIALRVVRSKRTLESQTPIDAIAYSSTLAALINGAVYDGKDYYLLVRADRDVKTLREELADKYGLNTELAPLPPIEGNPGLAKQALKYARLHFLVAAFAVLLAAAAPGLYAVSATAAFIHALLAALLTQMERGIVYMAGAHYDGSIEVQEDPYSLFRQTLVEKIPPFIFFYEPDINYARRLIKLSGKLFWKAQVFENVYYLKLAERLQNSLNRFERYGIKEEALNGYLLFPNALEDGVKALYYYQIGNPAPVSTFSGNFILFSPAKLLRHSDTYGVQIGYLKGRRDVPIYFDPVDNVLEGRDPHVIVIGTTGSGKTFFARMLSRGVAKMYCAQKYIVDPQGPWTPEASQVYNVKTHFLDVDIDDDFPSLVYDAMLIARYPHYEAASVMAVLKTAMHELKSRGVPVDREVLLSLFKNIPSVYSVLSSLFRGEPFRIDPYADLVITANGLASTDDILKMAFAYIYLVTKVIPKKKLPAEAVSTSPDFDLILKRPDLVKLLETRGYLTVEELVLNGFAAPLNSLLIIDEAHFFLHQTEGKNFLATNWITLRKYGIMLMAISQLIYHFDRDILNNTSTYFIFFFGKEPAQFKYIASMIKIDESVLHDFLTTAYTEYLGEHGRLMLYHNTSTQQIMQIVVPKELMSSIRIRLAPNRRYCGRLKKAT